MRRYAAGFVLYRHDHGYGRILPIALRHAKPSFSRSPPVRLNIHIVEANLYLRHRSPQRLQVGAGSVYSRWGATQFVGLEPVGETDFGKAGPRSEPDDGKAGPCCGDGPCCEDGGGAAGCCARTGRTMLAIAVTMIRTHRIGFVLQRRF